MRQKLRRRASYIDPRIDPQTRTAKVRVEVPNREGFLRLGMYMTVTFTTEGGTAVIVVPRAAVQRIGARQVVFVAVQGEEGRFIQRSVELGPLLDESYTVLEGLQPGEMVVTEGSFFSARGEFEKCASQLAGSAYGEGETGNSYPRMSLGDGVKTKFSREV